MYPGYYEEPLSMGQHYTPSPEQKARVAKFLATKLFSVQEDPAETEKLEAAIEAATSTEPLAYVFFVIDEAKPEL